MTALGLPCNGGFAPREGRSTVFARAARRKRGDTRCTPRRHAREHYVRAQDIATIAGRDLSVRSAPVFFPS